MGTSIYDPNQDDNLEEMRQALRLIGKEWPLLIERLSLDSAQLAQAVETLTSKEYQDRVARQLAQAVETLTSKEYQDRVARQLVQVAETLSSEKYWDRVARQLVQVVETLSSEECQAQRADFSKRVAHDFKEAPKRLEHVIDAFARTAEREP